MNQLEGALVRAFQGEDAAWDDVNKILRDVDYTRADAQVASQIVGMVSPWIPEVQNNPQGVRQVDLAIRGLDDILGQQGARPTVDGLDDTVRYPGLEDAVRFITDRKIMTADGLAGLTTAEQFATFAAPGINSPSTLNRLKSVVADSVKAGDDLPTFRKKAQEVVTLEKHQEETLYRTESKRAYSDGLDRTMERPAVKKRFPFVRLTATNDDRVRDHHWDLDGIVVEVDSPGHKILKQVIREYNCRCTLTPLTERQAEAMGGHTELRDFPSSVKQRYNV